MLPVLYSNGVLTIYTHDFFTTLGLLAGLAVYYYELRRRRMLNGKIFWISIAAIFGGGIGARLITSWEHISYYTDNFGNVTLTNLIAHSGKSIIGGIAGGYLAIYLSKKALRYPLTTADCYAPAIPLAMSIGRIGCFLSEYPLGTPTNLPWGIRLPPESLPVGAVCPTCQYPMHPSMIYEIIFHLIALFLIYRYRNRVYVKGETLKIYLLASAVFRFGVEFVRGNTEQLFGLTGPQVVLIPLTALLLFHFYRQWRRGVYRIPAPPSPAEIEQDVESATA
jgi:phosphatidylglycerol---prolipoprotein diacylglyceryl transferase